MKLITACFVAVLSVLPQTVWSLPEVSADIGRLYYEIGGGKMLPPPGSGVYTFDLPSSIDVGFGYSCGSFDYHSNVTQMLDEFMDNVRAIPQQFMDAFTGAFVGLPNYWVMKANASLYNTINETLDEATGLFRYSYASCSQMEAEMRQNPDSNIYQGFISASILDKWQSGAENNENIADVDEEVKQDPVDPIIWFGGNEAGTIDNPIQVNRDLVVAGYNILIGRTGDVSITTEPTGPLADEPIVRVWSNPEEAGRWAQEVLGDERLVLENGEPLPPETIPGRGLRPQIQTLETGIYDALMEIYERNDYTLIRNYLSLPDISGMLIDGLRTLPQAEAMILMDRLVSEMAVKEAQERIFQIRQMLYTAMKHPDLLAHAGAGNAASKIVLSRTFPVIRDSVAEIASDLELQHRAITPTVLTILDRADAVARSARTTVPGVTQKEDRIQ